MSILPAILTDDPAELRRQLHIIAGFSEWVHIDILDNTFVPGRTINIAEIEQATADIAVEMHLMVHQPERFIDTCVEHRVNRVLVHHGTLRETEDPVGLLKRFPCPVGIVLNPDVPVEDAEMYRDTVESVMIMGVQPGKQRQAQLPQTADRISEACGRFPDMPIAVDGGVNAQTIRKLRDAGAARFVVGSGIVHAPDPQRAFRELEDLLETQ